MTMSKTKRIAKENKWGDRSRFYEVDGKQYPSVTTILSVIGKPALIAWSAKVEREMVMEVSANLYEEVAESQKMSRLGWLNTLADRLGKTKASQKELAKASEIGSQAHSWIEWQIKRELMHKVGPCPIISPPAQLAVAAWERWRDSVNFKPLLCEQPVWSNVYRYAGTMDLLAEINGEITLLDWKTGKAIYDEAYLQNVAYRQALFEMRLLPELQIRDLKGMIVRLPKLEKDPEFEAKPISEDSDKLMHIFIGVLNLWKWLNSKQELVDSPEAQENGPTETKTDFPAVVSATEAAAGKGGGQ